MYLLLLFTDSNCLVSGLKNEARDPLVACLRLSIRKDQEHTRLLSIRNPHFAATEPESPRCDLLCFGAKGESIASGLAFGEAEGADLAAGEEWKILLFLGF